MFFYDWLKQSIILSYYAYDIGYTSIIFFGKKFVLGNNYLNKNILLLNINSLTLIITTPGEASAFFSPVMYILAPTAFMKHIHNFSFPRKIIEG